MYGILHDFKVSPKEYRAQFTANHDLKNWSVCMFCLFPDSKSLVGFLSDEDMRSVAVLGFCDAKNYVRTPLEVHLKLSS